MSPSTLPDAQVSVRPVHVFGCSVQLSEERKILFRFCSPHLIGADKGLVVPCFLLGEATKKRPFSNFAHTPSHDPRACTSIWDAKSLTLLCFTILCVVCLQFSSTPRLFFFRIRNVEIQGFTLQRLRSFTVIWFCKTCRRTLKRT